MRNHTAVTIEGRRGSVKGKGKIPAGGDEWQILMQNVSSGFSKSKIRMPPIVTLFEIVYPKVPNRTEAKGRIIPWWEISGR
jgi:hypothetical protein